VETHRISQNLTEKTPKYFRLR